MASFCSVEMRLCRPRWTGGSGFICISLISPFKLSKSQLGQTSAAMAVGYNARATEIDLTTLSGTPETGMSSPYMTAVFSQVGSGQVQVVLTASGLTTAGGYIQHITDVFLNLDSSTLISGLSMSAVEWTSANTLGIIRGNSNQQLGSGPNATANWFDIHLNFGDGDGTDTGPGSSHKEFTAGDVATITFTASGLLVSDFLTKDVTSSGGSTSGGAYLG